MNASSCSVVRDPPPPPFLLENQTSAHIRYQPTHSPSLHGKTLMGHAPDGAVLLDLFCNGCVAAGVFGGSPPHHEYSCHGTRRTLPRAFPPPGDHVLIKGGADRIPQALAEGLHVRLGHCASKVTYSESGKCTVQLTNAEGRPATVTADFVVVAGVPNTRAMPLP